MIYIRTDDILHRSYLNRILIEIIDNSELSGNLAFKGGTCAAMLGYLDRFSVDLDFDILKGAKVAGLRQEFHRVFSGLGLQVTRELDKAIFYQLRYPNEMGKRNNIKVSASGVMVKANGYRVQYLAEIDRLVNCQTIETMFANKLVAVLDRYQRHKTIAGRDIYDIHHFFIRGLKYNVGVIEERTGWKTEVFFRKLADFIRKYVNQRIINEDLNALLPPERFRQIRKILIPETLALLKRE